MTVRCDDCGQPCTGGSVREGRGVGARRLCRECADVGEVDERYAEGHRYHDEDRDWAPERGSDD